MLIDDATSISDLSHEVYKRYSLDFGIEMEFSSSESEEDDFPVRRRRVFRLRSNFYLDYFKERFRLSRGQAEALVQRLAVTRRHETRRNYALMPREQILLCLAY